MDRQAPKGFSYLEVIIATGILVLIAHTFFSLIIGSYHFLTLSRTQTTARGIAIQQLELIKNLPYESIGTISGIPSGVIAQTANKNVNGQTYEISTLITYIDNPADGISPTDSSPNDLKQVKVTVGWNDDTQKSNQINIFSNISPPSGQENSITGGTIIINVFDAQGIPVQGADVHLVASTLNPPIDMTISTNIAGQVSLPGSPICTACYQATVSKSGYSQDRTYSTQEIANPSKNHLSVISNQVTSISFAIDETSNITFKSYDLFSTNILPNNEFRLVGMKTIGTDASGSAVSKYDEILSTNESGELTTELEWDNYYIYPLNSRSFTGATNSIPVIITPNNPFEISYTSTPSSSHSLLTYVKDASSSAVPDATIIITSPSFSSTITTGSSTSLYSGFAYTSIPSPDTYTLEISHPNFSNRTLDLDIDGITQQTIILDPQ